MKLEPFWELVTYQGKKIPTTSSYSVRSLSGLQASVVYERLDEAYFQAFANPERSSYHLNPLFLREHREESFRG